MIKKTITNALCSLLLLAPVISSAEMLAMVNYESKPGQMPRKEGIAIINVDPDSPQFGKIINDLPLPPDAVAHHIFYNKDLSKAYITALGNGALRFIDMKRKPFQIEDISVPECQVAEDMVFTSDKKTWYLTCMGSSNVIVGDAQTDKVKQVIAADEKETFIKYPHGIGLNEDINRIMVTSTVRASDLGDPGDSVTVIEATTGKVLSTHKVGGAGSSTVEAVFVPHANPPLAYVNTMFEGKLWAATWEKNHHGFDFQPAYDFADVKQGVPLEIYFNQKHDKLFITTANPGALNIFDISESLTKPTLIKSIPTAGGAHHVVFSPDEKYAIVQNSFLNLPNMDDGSISVIDLQKMEKIKSIDTLKDQGFKPNCIVMLPQWHTDDAH
ncbi:MAG: YncE family protein [Methylococcales bacterium]|nr:YncE family protein [Methylococcales bacterium]MDD5753516.1 YncE family protein [Methylococcales bacterium]